MRQLSPHQRPMKTTKRSCYLQPQFDSGILSVDPLINHGNLHDEKLTEFVAPRVILIQYLPYLEIHKFVNALLKSKVTKKVLFTASSIKWQLCINVSRY